MASLLKLLCHPLGRYASAILAAVAAYSLTPPFLRYLAAWDTFALVYILLTFLMMHQCTPEDILQRVRKTEPSNTLILASTMITAVAAIVAVVEGSMQVKGLSNEILIIHAILSLIGVIGAWLFLNLNFAIHYARLYYHQDGPLMGGNPPAFKQGLAFPGQEGNVDYWDFVYYSFTIAMCYQTSDVSITSPVNAAFDHSTCEILLPVCLNTFLPDGEYFGECYLTV